jgi:hypothetical protein
MPPTTAFVSPRPSPTTPFGVTYRFTTEASYEQIEIKQARLIYTTFVDKDNKCAHWVAQAPCWTEQELTTREASLSASELRTLRDLLQQTAFLTLADSYGGAPPGQRYYPYQLSVTSGAIYKTVVYQSYPDAAPMPTPLRAVIDSLYALIHAKFR